MMETSAIHVSRRIYDILSQKAREGDLSPDELANELLSWQLLPVHPYVEIYQSRSGPRALIKGTRVGVSVIVGYTRMGYDPETIADEFLPHLTPAQVHDALSYYYDHQEKIDCELAEDSEAFWLEKLKGMMHSEEDFAKITGRKASK
jgi:uncharacterized protein (DUF433 family)